LAENLLWCSFSDNDKVVGEDSLEGKHLDRIIVNKANDLSFLFLTHNAKSSGEQYGSSP
jgi:diacylglycerol kinase family enzyme